MNSWYRGQLLAQLRRLRWLIGLAIFGMALLYRLLIHAYIARQWPELSWAIDVLFSGLLGGFIAWLLLTWIGRSLEKRFEEAEHLATVVRASPDAIVCLDERWAIKAWNRGAELMFGYDPEETIGQPFERLLPDKLIDARQLETTSQEIQERGYIREHEMEMLTRDKARITVQLTGNPLLGDGGKLTGFALILRDITALKMAEEKMRTLLGELEQKMRERTRKLESAHHDLEERNEELRQAYEELKELDRLKSDFVSMVSHELRSPLTNISGAVELMLEEDDLSDEYARKMLGVVGEQSDRLIRLVRGILDVSRIDAGRLFLDRKEVDILPILERVVSTLQATTVFHWFELPATNESPLVWGDEDRIEGILFNLLDNAIKFSPSGGQISIQMDAGDEEIAVSIADSGVGIAPDKQDEIFRKFHRLDSEDSRESYGHGLGLYITRGLVEAHGGQIWVESTEQEGSTFSFTLPLVRRTQHTEGTGAGLSPQGLREGE
jgi:PAS domain S-box-containing protein